MKFMFPAFCAVGVNVRLVFSSAQCLQTSKMPALWTEPVLPDPEAKGALALWREVGAETWLWSAAGSL